MEQEDNVDVIEDHVDVIEDHVDVIDGLQNPQRYVVCIGVERDVLVASMEKRHVP